MLHRFFIPPESIAGEQVGLDALAHQLRHVLRMHPGDRITILDNSGLACEVELVSLENHRAQGRIVSRWEVQTEPRLQLTLYLCMLKGDKFEWVLQKGAELGVRAFAPTISERTIARDGEDIARKRRRWESIIREAAEQSGRGRLPTLGDPATFADALKRSVEGDDLSLLPWEEARAHSLAGVLRSLKGRVQRVGLFIGPEGGLAAQEVERARTMGVQVVTLGPRILRAETAAVAATAVVMAQLGEM